MDPKIFKLPGIGKEHMKSYGKHGFFELNGVIYNQHNCLIRVELNRSVLVLDCAHADDLEQFCSDPFIAFLAGGSQTGIDVFVHMSHPALIGSDRYLRLLAQIEQSHAGASHLYLHPEFARNDVSQKEQELLFQDMAESFSFLEPKGLVDKN